jgi:hypothetical protein
MSAALTLANVDDYRADRETLDRNERKARGHVKFEWCFLCGLGMSKVGYDKAWKVHVVAGGARLAPAAMEWPPGDPGDVGWFAVGSECAKRIPLTYRRRP